MKTQTLINFLCKNHAQISTAAPMRTGTLTTVLVSSSIGLLIFLFGWQIVDDITAPPFVTGYADQYKGKVILVVNVASRCGFTKQYADLQKLYDENKSKGLIIIGVPSNDFGNQEPGSNKEIKNFCETNFGITFPIMAKTNILGDTGHPFYKWVEENYGKSGVPKWNFYKVLINRSGKIEDVYSSITNPSSKKIKNKINSILQ